ncbi:hypothetical protein NH340_JMT00097 [Sarcoptes scabiei]|nr:hypothetical protein NH340_JMT00097 [Sarcoptes scabiei]
MTSSIKILCYNHSLAKILLKLSLIFVSFVSIAISIYTVIKLKQSIDLREHFGLQSSNPLHYDQTIDQAKFDSFGLRLEPLWQGFLYCNLILIIILNVYLPMAIVFDQFYFINIFTTFMFIQMILACGSEYLILPFRSSAIIYFFTALIGHSLCHLFRKTFLISIGKKSSALI